jgi:transcriptional regulator with XRE-family HTH domain
MSKMIGDVLKRTRTIYGYKASEMSSMLGISKSYLSEIENNKKQPSLDLLKRYSDILGIKLSSLILLSEDFEEASKRNKSQEFIKQMMLRLINFMSDDKGVSNFDEKETKE